MKLMSARSRRAPMPVNSRKPEPEIFAARSKSRSPRFVARSQCGFGAKSNVRIVPHVRTTWFCVASEPGGTEGCGRFGIHAARFVDSSSS